MPVAEDWKTAPLQLVNKCFNARANESEWEKGISARFNHLLQDEKVRDGLPCLDHLANHELTDGQLVRFRGMVQDMYDPEIYLAEYETRNLSTGVRQVQCGRFRDILQDTLREELIEESDVNVMKEREVMYCVSIPALNAWAADLYAAKIRDNNAAGPSGTYKNPLKRGLDTNNENNDEESMETDDHNGAGGDVGGKRSRSENGEANANLISNGDGGAVHQNGTNGVSRHSTTGGDLNLPIPSKNGRAAIIKLYNEQDCSVKLTDVLDMVGIISLHPALAAEEPKDSALPPPSLVPRLHIVFHTKVTSINPLSNCQSSLNSASDILTTREQVLHILSSALLGDRLAAEYLLCHIISKIYGRRDVRVLGKMSMNLYKLNNVNNWNRRLYTLLSLLLPNSHYLPLSRQNLETIRLAPRKDFEANRLVSGMLQLPGGTNLVLDETALTSGQLNEKGVNNLKALGNLITWQKVEYDFKYHTLEYDADIPVLVLSEGRSCLPSDFALPVDAQQDNQGPLVDSMFKEIGSLLNEEVLNRIRIYLNLCRHKEYELSDSLQNEVQEDFVRMRQDNPNSMTVEDLHSHLVLARLVAVSKGKSSLEGEDWNRVKEMEATRRTRAGPPRAVARDPSGLQLNIHS